MCEFFDKRGYSASGKQTVAFAASVLWDNIPVDLKSLNVFNFSKKLKHYLLSEQHSETLS